MSEHSKYAISILVADRPGIMRDLATAIADMGANIDGISQTVVEGYFSVVLTASFPTPCAEDAVTEAVAAQLNKNEAAISIRPFEPTAKPASGPGETYVLTMTGLDKPGIIKTAAGCLADHGINIEDWQYEFSDEEVTYMAEITVPADLDIVEVRESIGSALAALDMRTNMQHRNIFRATNEIGPIKSLLGHTQDA